MGLQEEQRVEGGHHSYFGESCTCTCFLGYLSTLAYTQGCLVDFSSSLNPYFAKNENE